MASLGRLMVFGIVGAAFTISCDRVEESRRTNGDSSEESMKLYAMPPEGMETESEQEQPPDVTPPTQLQCNAPETGPFCTGDSQFCCPAGQTWTGSCRLEEQRCRITLPTPGAHNGHHDPNSGPDYNIWTGNCHTAANVTTCSVPNSGAVKCGGSPENQNNPANHTFNYALEGDQVCFYNWGEKKCCPGTTVPPDMTGACEAAIAKDFCGDQYGPGVESLPVGQIVEVPGPSACVAEVGVTGSLSSCQACCDRRANMWDDTWGVDKREAFRQDCKRTCEGFLGNR